MRRRWALCVLLASSILGLSADADAPSWAYHVSSTAPVDGLRRFVDYEAEVVCYTHTLYGSAISCLPRASTKLPALGDSR